MNQFGRRYIGISKYRKVKREEIVRRSKMKMIGKKR